MGIFGKKIQKCLLSSPFRFHKTFVHLAEFDWLPGLIFVEMFKIFSETLRWIKLILGIHVYDHSLYINCVFYSSRIRTLVAMATYNSHRLIMGKVSAVSLETLEYVY